MSETGKEVARYDLYDVPRMRRTEEGFLRGDALVARIGVQVYRNPDGTLRRELRHPDDVFSADSMESLKQLPMTLDHPDRLVTAENAKELSVGFTGDSIRVDGRWVRASMSVVDGNAILEIDRGRARQLSVGYTATVIEEKGTYDGEPYDYRQRNIRGNHIAIVQTARAGASASLVLDADDAISVVEVEKEDEMSDPKLSTIVLDGISYQASPEVLNALKKSGERVDALQAEVAQSGDELAKLRGELEAAKAKHDEYEAQIKQLRDDATDEKIQERVKERLALESSARKVLGDDAKFDGMNARQVQEAAIKKVHPDVKLDEASDVYVQARFDAVIDGLGAASAMANQRRAAAPTTSPGVTRDDAGGEKTAEQRRDEANSAIHNMWKRNDSQKAASN